MLWMLQEVLLRTHTEFLLEPPLAQDMMSTLCKTLPVHASAPLSPAHMQGGTAVQQEDLLWGPHMAEALELAVKQGMVGTAADFLLVACASNAAQAMPGASKEAPLVALARLIVASK